MSRDNIRVLTRGRFAATFLLVLFATPPACSESTKWSDLPLPLLMWTQEEGSWDQPPGHCVHSRGVDADWNVWQDEWCETPDGDVSPLPALSPAARGSIHQGFDALKTAEPRGRFGVPCPTNRRHKFVMKEPFPMLEEPTTWTEWVICAGARDDLTDVAEPFATIATALLHR